MSLMGNTHNGVNKWKCFPRYWLFVRGIHRSPVNSPHKGQWRESLMLSLICARTSDWVTNRDAGDLRRHRAHHDVIVMNGPVAYITTFYCGNAAKTVTLRTMWWKYLLPLPQRCMCPNFNREYRMVAALQRRKLNIFSSEKASFHRERWLGETPLGPSSRPRIKCGSKGVDTGVHLTPVI